MKTIVPKSDRQPMDRINKVMDETDRFHVRKIDPELAKRVIGYRVERKWRRADLARLLNMKEGLVADIETCRAVYDGRLVNKIRMVLKI